MFDLKEKLKSYNIIKEGHFQLTSGYHSNYYINKDKIWHYPILYSNIIYEFYKDIYNYLISSIGAFEKNFVITGPAVSGSVWASLLAYKLSIPFAYCEKSESYMIYRRGFDHLLWNKKVIIIEDIITTGSSIQKTIDAIKRCNGNSILVFAIWNRDPNKKKIDDVPIKSLINEKVKSYSPEECPLCKKNIPLENPK